MNGETCTLTTNEEFVALKVKVESLREQVEVLWGKQDATEKEIRSNKDKYMPAIALIERTANELKDHEEEAHNQFAHVSSTLGSLHEVANANVKELDLVGGKVRELVMSDSKSIERDFHISKDIKEIKDELKKSQDAYFSQFREHDRKEMEKYDAINKAIIDLTKAIKTEKEKNDKRYGRVLKVFWTVSGGLAVIGFIFANLEKIKGML